jgi:molecular chaperone DnaK
LTLCKAICNRVLEKADLKWGDLDEIVLAGGSCRMPMVIKMIEDLSGKKVKREVEGFNYDTAIAMGAAIFGSRQRRKIKDVTSKTIGIELKDNGNPYPYVHHLISKNKHLPIKIEKVFKAEKNAVLKIYEGESMQTDECLLRGRLKLENPLGEVKVRLEIDEDGVLSATVEYPPNGIKKLKIISDEVNTLLEELKEKISNIDIRL